jgi:hypothetical protein
MANEFPKLSEVFKIGTEVTYDEAIEKVFLPQDNAVKSIPSISPIETVTLTGNKIVPTAFLAQIQIVENLSNELHFIDYTNLRDGAILQLRILDNNNPIVIKNGISGVGSIMTADGNDIELNDYRTIVQLQLEGTLWRQVGGIQAQADWNQVDSKKPDFIKNKPTNLLDSTRITNCITEIPQDIKLELNNGTVTLKAGSKVYVPNGVEDGLLKFDEVVLSEDLIRDEWDTTTGSAILFMDNETIHIQPANVPVSGATAPSNPSANRLWYDTSNNLIKYYNGSEWVTTIGNGSFSLPIALITKGSTGVPSSIDQVFNGFGYIGSTVFALPGVKGLIPNGRNEDGSLKNDIFSVTNVIPMTTISSPNGIKSIYFTTSGGAGITSSYTYDLQKNILLDTEDNDIINGCIAINFVWDNSQQAGQKITSFTPKLPFRAADHNELNEKVELKQDKATAVNYGNITNCITEIPQDIKLELNNGELTLKAGSKVWIPYLTSDINVNIGATDGFGNTVVDKSFSGGKFFYAIKTSVDAITTTPAINTYTVVYNPKTKNIDYWGWDGITSFDGYNTIDGMHYNTSENNIRIIANGGIYGDNFSLPICIVSKNTTSVTGFTSIDQVFNGLGYIGSTIFALPGVKMLTPWGRNEDGSLKNVEKTTNKVVINTNPNDVNNAVICLSDTSINSFYLGFTKPVFGWATHQEDENKNYLSTVETDYCFVGRLQGDSNKKITDFKPKLPFRAVDQSSLNNFVLVSALPTNPDSNTFYFIPE